MKGEGERGKETRIQYLVLVVEREGRRQASEKRA